MATCAATSTNVSTQVKADFDLKLVIITILQRQYQILNLETLFPRTSHLNPYLQRQLKDERKSRYRRSSVNVV
jgi:hypothetical protein